MAAYQGTTYTYRTERRDIEAIFAEVAAHEELVLILESIPGIALILNRNRQVVFTNSRLVEQLQLTSVKEALVQRPGELMHCLHAHDGVGCGEGEACRYCGAVQAVLECQRTNTQVTREVQLTVRNITHKESLDLSVTATPLKIGNNELVTVYFTDISSFKRKQYLEMIFIHDILNMICCSKTLADTIKMQKDSKATLDSVEVLREQLNLTAEEIRGHQILLNAENGVLQTNLSVVPLCYAIQSTLKSARIIAEAGQVKIDYAPSEEDVTIVSDIALLKRVLLNGLKNAIEAAKAGETVRISYKQHDSDKIVIMVNNDAVMSDETRERVFSRSYSTKGKERGLGTYSMRLLTEEYLGGQVSFKSSEENGTTFFITIPVVKRSDAGVQIH